MQNHYTSVTYTTYKCIRSSFISFFKSFMFLCLVQSVVLRPLTPFRNHTPKWPHANWGNPSVPMSSTGEQPWLADETSRLLKQRQSSGLTKRLVASISCVPTDEKQSPKMKGTRIQGCRICGQGASNVACLCCRLDAINLLMLSCWASIYFLATNLLPKTTRLFFLWSTPT